MLNTIMEEQKPGSVIADDSAATNTATVQDPGKQKKSFLPDSVKISLLVFALASGIALTIFPRISNLTSSSPSYWIFVGAGFIMIALTTLLFIVLSQLKLGFGASALVLALGYNCIIAVIKFGLSPKALYLANQHSPFDTKLSDPNSSLFYLLTSVLVLFLYIGVFAMIYRYFVNKLNNQQVRQDAKENYAKVFSNPKLYIRLYLLFGIVGLIIYGVGIIFLPFLELGTSLSYLSYVFGTFSIPLLLAIGAGIFLAYHSFNRVSKQVVVTGNTALLASFFWLGVSLIVIYHILWIIFMLTLIHIWPFKTYTPK